MKFSRVITFWVSFFALLNFVWLDAEAINNGQDVFKPISRCDLKLEFQNGVDRIKGRSAIATIRIDEVLQLPQNWELAVRGNLPYEWFSCGHKKRGCQKYDHLGDSFFQALFVAPEFKHWAWGVGMRVILPTAADNLEVGDGKYQLAPMGGFRYDFSWWKDGMNAGIVAWQAVSVAGYRSAPSINQTHLQPFFNFNLTKTWFVSMSPEIIYNWTTNQWFVPVDILIGKMLGKHFVVSLDYDYGLVQTYPQFNQEIEFRVGVFF